MLGLMVLLALGVYLAVSALVIWLAVRWAKKRNRKPWVWGGLAAFLMYNLVFWDLIPTLAMHKYYCATEAGFWVYKTPEQWAKENPGVLETLKPWPVSRIYGDDRGVFQINGGTVRHFNERLGLWELEEKPRTLFLIERQEVGIFDVQAREFLALRVNYFAGKKQAGEFWKSWLNKSTCNRDDAVRNMALIRHIATQLHMGEI